MKQKKDISELLYGYTWLYCTLHTYAILTSKLSFMNTVQKIKNFVENITQQKQSTNYVTS